MSRIGIDIEDIEKPKASLQFLLLIKLEFAIEKFLMQYAILKIGKIITYYYTLHLA